MSDASLKVKTVKNGRCPMPAIITHDRFAHEMLELPATSFISSTEKNAFLLGSQGPDPLFSAS